MAEEFGTEGYQKNSLQASSCAGLSFAGFLAEKFVLVRPRKMCPLCSQGVQLPTNLRILIVDSPQHGLFFLVLRVDRYYGYQLSDTNYKYRPVRWYLKCPIRPVQICEI